MEYPLQEKYDLIKREIVTIGSKNPVTVVREMMRKDFISLHGSEHHFLDGAAFLTAWRNAGGETDLDFCLEKLAQRTLGMPGAMCAHWGVCGSVAAVGAALSVLHGTGPLSEDEFYKDNMEYTAAVLKKMSEIGGARCCKRNAFLALSYAAKFAREKYGVPMETDEIICEFSPRNRQCIRERCPFFHPSEERDRAYTPLAP